MGLKQYVKNIICENETAKRAYIKRRGRDALLIKKAIVSIGPFIYAMRHKEDSFSRNGYIAKVAVGGGGSEPCVSMYLPYALKDDVVQKNILYSGCFFEYDNLNRINEEYIREGMTILDCGANVGNHSLYFAKVSHAKKVYAFEASEDTYRILKKNIELNGLEDVITAENVALGEKDSRASIKFVKSKTNTGFNQVEEDDDGTVNMRPLDELVTEKIDFIKIDVEGYELNVLKGARRILSEMHPIIMIEIWKHDYEAVSPFIISCGYNMKAIDRENYICTWNSENQ